MIAINRIVPASSSLSDANLLQLQCHRLILRHCAARSVLATAQWRHCLPPGPEIESTLASLSQVNKFGENDEQSKSISWRKIGFGGGWLRGGLSLLKNNTSGR